MAARIVGFAEPRRLALAFIELDLLLGGALLVPDVTVHAWDRIPRDASGTLTDADILTPPAAIFEVLTPADPHNWVLRRALWLVDQGVPRVFLMDAQDRSVAQLTSGGHVRMLLEQDAIELPELLPGFSLTVDDLFEALHVGRSRSM